MTKTVGNSGLIDTWAATGTQTEPNEAKKNLGWTEGERPAFDFMNFLQAQFGEKINHIMANGVPLWNAKDTYAVNAITARAGVVYVALTSNTNSQPPSVNWRPLVPDVTDIIGGVFAGQVAHFAMNSAPDGWLIANGQAVSRSTYARLFGRIGTIYGAGNGSTTFNLPDMRGEFLRGLDNGRGIDAGRVLGSLQLGSVESHSHTGTTATNGSHSHGGSTSSAGDHTHSGSTASNGAHAHLIANKDNVFAPRNTLLADTVLGNQGGTGGESAYHLGGLNPATYPHNAGITNTTGAHSHTFGTNTAGAHAHTVSTDIQGNHSHTFTTNATGGTETRPRNVAMLACIKW